MSYNFVKTIIREEQFPFKFSICTLVSKPKEYSEMIDSFILAGFDPVFCEYLCVDNSLSNTYDAFEGFNRFLQEAKGKYIILCHQDILLLDHQINDLELRIKQMDMIDSRWAILGNAGGINLKYLAKHLSQISGNSSFEENLPLKAHTIDENFILVKNEANLALSSDLKGFHLYGTDICLIAETLGFSTYIIDFKLTHKSGGKVDESFFKIRKDLMNKYRKALRGRYISTTITRFYISGNAFTYYLGNLSLIKFFVRQYYKYFRPKVNYHYIVPAEE